jgi:hypothetical protein
MHMLAAMLIGIAEEYREHSKPQLTQLPVCKIMHLSDLMGCWPFKYCS